MDFLSDALTSGRTFRCLTVTDGFTREALAIDVGHSIPPSQAIDVLERLRPERGLYLEGPERDAEELAELCQIEQGGWHMFRRAWATARKGLPAQDVMAASGWRDVDALQEAYQGADAETTRKVVEFGESA